MSSKECTQTKNELKLVYWKKSTRTNKYTKRNVPEKKVLGKEMY